jgi:hypothetical protein
MTETSQAANLLSPRNTTADNSDSITIEYPNVSPVLGRTAAAVLARLVRQHLATKDVAA